MRKKRKKRLSGCFFFLFEKVVKNYELMRNLRER